MAGSIQRDHHSLRRNLKLNDYYISNDGHDEGIRIHDTGLVAVSGDLDIALNMTIADNEIAVSSGNFALDVASTITLDSDTGNIALKKSATAGYIAIAMDSGGFNYLQIMDPADAGDFCILKTTTNGATTLATISDTSADAHINIEPAGDLIISPTGQDVKIKVAGGVLETIVLHNGSDGTTKLTLASILDTGDYFRIGTAANGATIITTVDDDGTGANLTLNIDGTVEINSSADDSIILDAGGSIVIDTGSTIALKEGGTEGLQFSNTSGDWTIEPLTSNKDIILATFGGTEVVRLDTSETALYIDKTLAIKEASAAPANKAGYGKLWVKNEDPTVLMFTDDDETDIQITGSSASINVAADEIRLGDSQITIGNNTNQSHNIVFQANSADWLIFNTSDTSDGGTGVGGVSEILGINNKRLRIRSQGQEESLQLCSGQSVQIAHFNDYESEPGGSFITDTIKEFRLSSQFTITTAEWDIPTGLDDGTGTDPTHVRHNASTHADWGYRDDTTFAYNGHVQAGRIIQGMYCEAEAGGCPHDSSDPTKVESVQSNLFFEIDKTPTADALVSTGTEATMRFWESGLYINPTIYRGTLQGLWKADQDWVNITQVVTQNATTIPAQYRGSTSGSRCIINVQTNSVGLPRVSSSPVNGGKDYTTSFTFTCSYNHTDGLDEDGTTGDDNLEDRSLIYHADDNGKIKLYMSVVGTGIPIGSYVGEVDGTSANAWFRIHKLGGTGALHGDDRMAVSATVVSGSLSFYDRICFQDPTDTGAGGTDNHMVLEVLSGGSGTIQFGIQSAGQVTNGSMIPKIEFDFNEGRTNLHMRDRLRIIGRSGGVFQTDVDTFFMSGAQHITRGGQDFTFVHAGDRMFFGSTACNTCSMFFDNKVSSNTKNRIWLGASNLDNGTAKLGDQSDWEGRGGLEISTTTNTGATHFASRHKTGGDNKAAHMSFEANGSITLTPQMDMKVLLEKLYVGTTDATPILQDLIYTITGNTDSGEEISHKALNITMSATDDDGAGTGNFTGIDVNVTADSTTGEKNAKGIDIAVSGGDTNYALITAGGNVGIGVADPDQALEVNGGVHIEDTAYFTTPGTVTGDGTTSIDWRAGNKYHLTFAASTNETITFANNPSGACNLILKLKQPASGAGCTADWTMSAGTLYWVGGGTDETGEPTLSTGVNDVDIISFYFDGTNYYGVASLGFDA